MSDQPRFIKGALGKQIRGRGLSNVSFAKRAGVTANTVRRADQGLDLKPQSFGKILIALSEIPVLRLPRGLVKSA